jgi:RNA polymerase sigma-70 factor, ECF subfamily
MHRNVEIVMPRQRSGIAGGNEGDLEGRRVLDDFFAVRYGELRRIAAKLQRTGDNLTVSPTMLVHEAWLRLANTPSLESLSQAHFKAMAARAMRHALIDAARRRRAGKRSAEGGLVAIVVDDEIADVGGAEQDVLGLDAALCALDRIAPRQARLVEARYFGGLTVTELAHLLDVSKTTVEREWRVAKAWLKSELRRA